MELEAGEQIGMAIPCRAQDIGGESSVAGACLNQIDRRLLTADCRLENAGHLADLELEQFSEERADIDAGKEIARASRPLGHAGVVTEFGIVKREIHERGHRHRAACTNDIFNPNSQSSV